MTFNELPCCTCQRCIDMDSRTPRDEYTCGPVNEKLEEMVDLLRRIQNDEGNECFLLTLAKHFVEKEILQ